MKRTFARILGASLMLVSSAVSAVALNPRGIGQVLIYPYYTVNRGQDTLISVANAASSAKLARVRFLEGYNGRTVFSEYVFLSAHDTWTAAVTQTADDGGARLATSDHSCMYPALTADNAVFTSADYDGTDGNDADDGPQDITRTREGLIEIIEAGDIVAGSAAEAEITHVQNGAPGQGVPSCHFAQAPGAPPIDIGDLAPPTGGLYGSGSIVDVAQGTFFAYGATALAGFTDQVPVADLTDAAQPSLDQAHSSESDATARAYVPFDDGHVVGFDFDRGIDAVTAVLMATSISNEFVTGAGLGANTDWVITFPTKRFYVDENLPDTPLPPFVETFGEHIANDDTHIHGVSRIVFPISVYDREELATSNVNTDCGFLCPSSPPLQLSYEVNIFGLLADGTLAGTPSGVLGSRLSSFYYGGIGQPPRGDTGWFQIDLLSGDGGHVMESAASAGDPVLIEGLPAVGFMVYNIVNANAQPGVLGNYGGAFAHRSTFACVGTPCPPSQ